MSKPRRDRRDIDGWIVLDKPSGMTSTQAVGAVRWALKAKKAGHAGTLDPLATGVLPIALGEATKTVSFAMDGLKRYRFTVKWGQSTDTDDSEGKVIATSGKRPTTADIEALLPRYTGVISQIPPRYSAIKIDGERAYDLARDGEVVELEAREVEILNLTLTGQPDADHAVFECECGKGTYVRSLARDMGQDLGTLGHVTALRRTRVGDFDEADATPLAAITALREGEKDGEAAEAGAPGHAAFIRPVEASLGGIPRLQLSRDDAARLRRGQSVLLRGRDAPLFEGAAYVTALGELIAMGHVEQGSFHPTRVFNLKG